MSAHHLEDVQVMLATARQAAKDAAEARYDFATGLPHRAESNPAPARDPATQRAYKLVEMAREMRENTRYREYTTASLVAEADSILFAAEELTANRLKP